MITRKSRVRKLLAPLKANLVEKLSEIARPKGRVSKKKSKLELFSSRVCTFLPLTQI
jgi:hypothetical protein